MNFIDQCLMFLSLQIRSIHLFLLQYDLKMTGFDSNLKARADYVSIDSFLSPFTHSNPT